MKFLALEIQATTYSWGSAFIAFMTTGRTPESSWKGLKSPYHRTDVRTLLPTLQTQVVNLHLISLTCVNLFTVCKLYFPGLLVSTDDGPLFNYSAAYRCILYLRRK